MSRDQLILGFVKRIRKRLCGQTFLKWTVLAAATGLFVWGIFNTVALFVPFYNAILYGFIAFAVVLIAGMIYSIHFFPNVKETALRVDATGLKERVTTSLDLSGKDDVCSTIVKDDTLRYITDYLVCT